MKDEQKPREMGKKRISLIKRLRSQEHVER